MADDDRDLEENEEQQWDPDDPRPWRKGYKVLERKSKETETALNDALSRLDEYDREKALTAAARESGVEGVSLTDLAGVPKDQITPTLLRVKAEEKSAEREVAERKQAEDLGMSVEDFRQALEAVKQKSAEERQELAAAGAVAQAGPPGPSPTKTPEEAGWEAFQDAKAKGLPEDQARAEYMRAKREQAMSAAPAAS